MSGKSYRRQFGFRILISDAWNASVSAELPLNRLSLAAGGGLAAHQTLIPVNAHSSDLSTEHLIT